MGQYVNVWVPQYACSTHWHTASIVSHRPKSQNCLLRKFQESLVPAHTSDVQVCTRKVQVHTSTCAGHTHTSFPIRHNHHCDAHESPSHACPMLCGQPPSYRKSPRWVRPPRQGLPRPNCHSHVLASKTLLQRLPSTAAESAQPIGNPEFLFLLYLWRIVGVAWPARYKSW